MDSNAGISGSRMARRCVATVVRDDRNSASFTALNHRDHLLGHDHHERVAEDRDRCRLVLVQDARYVDLLGNWPDWVTEPPEAPTSVSIGDVK